MNLCVFYVDTWTPQCRCREPQEQEKWTFQTCLHGPFGGTPGMEDVPGGVLRSVGSSSGPTGKVSVQRECEVSNVSRKTDTRLDRSEGETPPDPRNGDYTSISLFGTVLSTEQVPWCPWGRGKDRRGLVATPGERSYRDPSVTPLYRWSTVTLGAGPTVGPTRPTTLTITSLVSVLKDGKVCGGGVHLSEWLTDFLFEWVLPLHSYPRGTGERRVGLRPRKGPLFRGTSGTPVVSSVAFVARSLSISGRLVP